MVTVSQLVRKSCARKVAKSSVPTLETYSQKCGVCTRIYITTPKRPNSALHKVRRIRLTSDFEVTFYIGGEGHDLQERLMVLICDGHVKDLSGVRHHTVHDTLDCFGVKDRKRSRSKYDVERPKT